LHNVNNVIDDLNFYDFAIWDDFNDNDVGSGNDLDNGCTLDVNDHYFDKFVNNVWSYDDAQPHKYS
jgi:hypothetical protein